MKKINCEFCKTKQSNATWYVFGSMMICETCRLAVVNYQHDLLGFAPHIFFDEFRQVSPDSVINL